MNIWRLHVRPDAFGENPVDLCLTRDIIGIGWRVPIKPTSKEDYWRQGEKTYGDTSWRKAANAVVYKMLPDDLVWIRDFNGIYYIGRVDSDWKYMDDDENLRADIINIREAELYKVGTSIAGKIINCFRPGATVQRIKGETAWTFSKLVFNKLSKREKYRIEEEILSLDIFELLNDVDLEDVIGLYLQLEQDYVMVPSSRSQKNDTPFFEYQLILKSTSESAYVQVKSGNIRINLDSYIEFGRKIYLFSPEGYTGQGSSNSIALNRNEIEKFLWDKKEFMPLSIKVWIDYISNLSQRKLRSKDL